MIENEFSSNWLQLSHSLLKCFVFVFDTYSLPVLSETPQFARSNQNWTSTLRITLTKYSGRCPKTPTAILWFICF